MLTDHYTTTAIQMTDLEMIVAFKIDNESHYNAHTVGVTVYKLAIQVGRTLQPHSWHSCQPHCRSIQLYTLGNVSPQGSSS